MNGRTWRMLLPLTVILLLLTGCNNPEMGYDSQGALTSTETPPQPTCASCHSAGSSLDPLTSNGSGLAGQHQIHAGTRAIACTTCHEGYSSKATHMNGSLDTPDSNISLVRFDATNPNAIWSKDTGANTGSCANTTCHGGVGSLSDWYTTKTPLTCVSCHFSGGAIDPVILNGTLAEGKHKRHVVDLKRPCEDCHENYRTKATHADGTLDTPTASVNLIAFSSANSNGAWTLDTGAGTGSCANTTCHGGAGTQADWYTTAVPLACATCHISGGSLDPLTTNATGTNGKHQKHVTDLNLSCDTCHKSYRTQPTHGNGILDTADPGVTLVSFNTLNSSAQWWWDTGAKTGSCVNTYCHYNNGINDWYTPVTLTCTNCHIPGTGMDPLTTNGTGTRGKHVFHVTTKSLACTACHKGYPGQPTHTNGVFNSAATSDFLVIFDSLINPGAAWSDSGANTGSCGTVGCHQIGSTSNQWYGP
ncbi:MAG: CxxxxCH/CxxCH domain-containing protein [Deltaproteobacteria bacterium]|nr:CxxxxCH/CxxCH domain-containing protein [Deltaproteobacteria bacterium]